jgi:hypothetical protein
MAKQNKKQKDKKIEPTTKKSKKRFIIKYFLILLVIAFLMFITYRYTEEAKETSYLKGGQNAIVMITEAAQNKGGVSITNGNNTIILSKYNKEIVGATTPIIEETPPEETPPTEATNQTE